MTDVDRERRAQSAKAAIRSYQEWLRANRNAITTHVLNERLMGFIDGLERGPREDCTGGVQAERIRIVARLRGWADRYDDPTDLGFLWGWSEISKQLRLIAGEIERGEERWTKHNGRRVPVATPSASSMAPPGEPGRAAMNEEA